MPSTTDLGTDALRRGDLAAAVSLLERAQHAAPRDYLAAFYLGVAYQRGGRALEAAAAFHHALALQPNAVQAHFHLGETLEAIGQRPEAETSYRRALAVEPGHTGAAEGVRRLWTASRGAPSPGGSPGA